MRELELVLDDMATESAVERATWEDVLKRAQMSGRRSRGWIGAVAAAVVVLAAAPAFAFGLGAFDGTPIAATDLSTHDLHVLSAMATGESVRVPSSRAQDITDLGSAELRLISIRDGHAFFAAPRSGGGLCLSVGTADPLNLGQILCTPDFPSASKPLLDMSAFAGPLQHPIVTRLQGFVTDEVASVGVLTDRGIVAITPVEKNVYSRTTDLPEDAARGIVALDDRGVRIYAFCIDPQGCTRR